MQNLHIPTLQHLYTDILPHFTHSATQLYIHYYFQSQLSTFNNTLDLTQFCKETNTSVQTAYRALNTLKEKELIPSKITFINTYNSQK